MNLDVRSSERILPNAPLIGYDDAFKTKALKSFDLVSDFARERKNNNSVLFINIVFTIHYFDV